MRKFPISVRIAEIRRELALRQAVYPGQVARGRLKQYAADNHLAIMQDVHDTLIWLAENEEKIASYLASLKEQAA